MVDRILDSFQIAEEKLKQPPNLLEAYVELKRKYSMTVPLRNGYDMAGLMSSIFREDKIYANDTFTQFSLTSREGYMTFS